MLKYLERHSFDVSLDAIFNYTYCVTCYQSVIEKKKKKKQGGEEDTNLSYSYNIKLQLIKIEGKIFKKLWRIS